MGRGAVLASVNEGMSRRAINYQGELNRDRVARGRLSSANVPDRFFCETPTISGSMLAIE